MRTNGTDGRRNNIPNNYSFAIHAQNFGPWAARIPWIVLVTFGFVATIVVGACAAKFFDDTLQTSLSIMGVLDDHPHCHGHRRACHLPSSSMKSLRFRCLGQADTATVWFGICFWVCRSCAWDEDGVVRFADCKVGWEKWGEHRARADLCLFRYNFPVFRYLEKRYNGGK